MYFDTSGTTRPFKILSGLRATEVLASGIVHLFHRFIARADMRVFCACLHNIKFTRITETPPK